MFSEKTEAGKAQEDLVNRKLTHTVASKRVSGRSLEKEGHTNNSAAETRRVSGTLGISIVGLITGQVCPYTEAPECMSSPFRSHSHTPALSFVPSLLESSAAITEFSEKGMMASRFTCSVILGM